MSIARFRVMGRLDRAAGACEGTVVIEREAGLFSVRPLRRRRIYTLPLSVVADMVVHWVLRSELAEKRRAKAERRRLRKPRP